MDGGLKLKTKEKLENITEEVTISSKIDIIHHSLFFLKKNSTHENCS